MQSHAKRILIVEDDLDIAEIVNLLLTGEGYEVSCLNRAEGFEQELASFIPDLILLDIRLPDGNGIELCKKLKETNVSNPPVILMSAHANPADALKEAHADTFIEKPFDIDLFTSIINEKVHTNQSLTR